MAAPEFYSTRNKEQRADFRTALMSGIAPDGGLYVPASIPDVDTGLLQNTSFLPGVAFEMLYRWTADSVPEERLKEIIVEALNFPVPVIPLDSGSELYVLELFHGPTLSFKDFGARIMARLMSYFLEDRDERLTILVATSGDTGSAVADGFAGCANIDVVLLYPKGQVSEVQERQLIVERPGVRAFSVMGTFDDCQKLVKGAFSHPQLREFRLTSANSINIGRLLPQSVYYAWAATRVKSETVNFCVPSGNLGNLTGGVLAAESGLMVNRFIAAHNANDFFVQFLERGEAGFQSSVQTLSNAMDVGAPSNFERLHAMFGSDSLRARIWGTSVSDDETMQRMKQTFDETGYIADPHTAVGIEAVRRYRDQSRDATPAIVLSTAHPAKFPDTVREAIDQPAPQSKKLTSFFDKSVSVEDLPANLDAFRDALLEIHRA